jgi:hypothetical protein
VKAYSAAVQIQEASLNNTRAHLHDTREELQALRAAAAAEKSGRKEGGIQGSDSDSDRDRGTDRDRDREGAVARAHSSNTDLPGSDLTGSARENQKNKEIACVMRDGSLSAQERQLKIHRIRTGAAADALVADPNPGTRPCTLNAPLIQPR